MSYPAYQQTAPSSFRCHSHPEREGVGICVGCRAVVCVECTTKIDRMNYCIRCLQSAAVPERDRVQDDPHRDTMLGVPLLVGSFFLTVAVFAALGLLLAMIRTWTGGGVTGA